MGQSLIKQQQAQQQQEQEKPQHGSSSSSAAGAGGPIHPVSMTPLEAQKWVTSRLGVTMPVKEAEKWVVCRTPKPQAKLRMICLPWAGGNSTIYHKWADLEDVEVVAIELPARQGRLSDEAIKDFDLLVAHIAEALDMLNYLRADAKSLIIFGHSFGSMLAVHLAMKLREAPYRFMPTHVIVSGGAPLNLRQPSGVSSLSDDAITSYLVSMGGVPPIVASNRELMSLFIPAIRADYYAIDHYTYKEAPPLSCPLLALSGTQDDKASPAIMEGWRQFTTSSFVLVPFEGGHFFPKDKKDEVLQVITDTVVKPALSLWPRKNHEAPATTPAASGSAESAPDNTL